MNSVVRVNFIKTMTFQERLARSEGDGHTYIEHSRPKKPGIYRHPVENLLRYSRHSKEASRAGAE